MIGVDADPFDPFGPSGVAVDRDHDPIDADVSRGDLERRRHLRTERLQNAVAPASEHGIVRAGHADVTDVGHALGQHPLIGGDDMGVRPKAATRAAVEVIAHRNLLAGGLGVEVHYDQVRLLLKPRDPFVGGGIGAVGRLHEQPANQRQNPHHGALARLVQRGAPAGGVFGEVRRPADVVRPFQGLDDVALAERMVAKSDQIHAISQQLVVDLGREARSAGGVLGVGDHTVDGLLAHEGFELVGQDPPARAAHDIPDAQYVQSHRFLSATAWALARIIAYLAYSMQRTSRNSVIWISPG